MTKPIFALITLALFASSAHSSDISEIEGLSAAITAHNTALLSGDRNEVANTVMFPHVQFYPDGRTVVNKELSDLTSEGDEQLQWRIAGISLVTYENSMAIVRVSFEGVGENAGQDYGAGLWCFMIDKDTWKLYWRHYLGQDANR
jgi:hypothetical protein